jgi:hypothetical protein
MNSPSRQESLPQKDLDPVVEGVTKQTPQIIAKRLLDLHFRDNQCQKLISGIEAYIRNPEPEGHNKTRQLMTFPGFTIEEIQLTLDLLKSLIADKFNSLSAEAKLMSEPSVPSVLSQPTQSSQPSQPAQPLMPSEPTQPSQPVLSLAERIRRDIALAPYTSTGQSDY